MSKAIAVKLRYDSNLHNIISKNDEIRLGDFLILSSKRGLELARAINIIEDEVEIDNDFEIVKKASSEDMERFKSIVANEKNAYKTCKERIEAHGLEMKLVTVEYTFDESKLIAYFTANGRVDFRNLVRDLASIFKLRIELKQIGVRDEAKLLDGLGPCGRPLCCASFLRDFEPVSIKMAKEQGLSLNPTKISGICGRLMCCLKYEQDFYEQAHKQMPKVGKSVATPEGKGTVLEINILKELVVVQIEKENANPVIRTFKLNEIKANDGSCCCSNDGACACPKRN